MVQEIGWQWAGKEFTDEHVTGPDAARKASAILGALGSGLRRWVRGTPWLRKLYLWVKFAPGAEMRRRRTLRANGAEWARELDEVTHISSSGLYDLDLALANPVQSYQGRNFLGYPPMSGLHLDGMDIGWSVERLVFFESLAFPAYQVATDLEFNLPLLFETYRPGLAIDVGTASGATSVLFAQLMSGYARDGRVMTVDINDPTEGPSGESFTEVLKQLRIISHVGDAISDETRETVREFLNQRREETVLVSLDDDHSADHVLQELGIYAELLRPGDVIVVQDTWDQGFRDAPISALLGVLRFLRQSDTFVLDRDLLWRLKLPCSFVHGVLVRTR